MKELFTEELRQALPSDHPLTRKLTANLTNLAGQRLMVMKQSHCPGDQVPEFCDRRDAKPIISFRSTRLETVRALVTTGLGFSPVPAMAVAGNRKDWSIAPFYPSTAKNNCRHLAPAMTASTGGGRVAKANFRLAAKSRPEMKEPE